MRRETILAADIGGTNTRCLAYLVGSNELILNKKYENHHFKGFKEVLQQFFIDSKLKSPPLTACLAVAGPVDENTCVLTNRNTWIIDGNEIEKSTGIKRVRLINDFLAVGYGLLTLNEKTECKCIQVGKKKLGCPIACIGAGTGLGECFLTPSSCDGSYNCFPSEGGHGCLLYLRRSLN